MEAPMCAKGYPCGKGFACGKSYPFPCGKGKLGKGKCIPMRSEFDGAGADEVSVKVGNLPPDCTAEELAGVLAAYGIDSMTDCYIPAGRKFGFVRFATPAEGWHALKVCVWLRDHQLEMEVAQGQKRTSSEMQEMMQRPGSAVKTEVVKTEASVMGAHAVPDDPDANADAPSVKVSNLPPNTSSEELHEAFMQAGCRGQITDVYVPKGNRGFGFVRFARPHDVEQASTLEVNVRGCQLGIEVAVALRKSRKVMEEAELFNCYGPNPYIAAPCSIRRGPYDRPGKGCW